MIDWVKSSLPLVPGRAVLGPGDIERQTRAARLASGVPLDDKTCSDLIAAAQSVGIDSARARAMMLRSGGAAPNHALASARCMAIFIGSPTLSAVNIRLSLICASLRPMSFRRL